RAEAGTRAGALERSHAEAEARLPALEQERRGATSRLEEAMRELATLEAALAALESQQARLDTNEKLKEWITAHGLERAERLWQAIHVEPGWDDAIEAALGMRLNALKLSDESQLPALLRDAPPGSLALFIDRGAGEIALAASRLTPLASVVSAPRPGVGAYLR